MNERMKASIHLRLMYMGTIVILIVIFSCLSSEITAAQELAKSKTLPDLSGLAWLEGDIFIGVHDAKRSKEKYNWPRISLIRLPTSELEGVIWEPLNISFPGSEGWSSDLESACRIPGGNAFLFAESGQEGERNRRIFYAVFTDNTLKIESFIHWPVAIKNVEASEVCKIGDKLIFMYAERAGSLPSTKLRWATLSLNPFKLGTFKEKTYKGIDPVGKGARPIVALDVDKQGYIYSVSAYDPGCDDGPYRSVIWKIGRVTADHNGEPKIDLDINERVANMDGLKVESISVRELKDGHKQLFIGTDDEHYGGIIRLLPHIHD